MENFKIFPVRIGNNVTVFGKSLLMLFCNASGVPRPRIEWSRENGKIERKYLKQDNLLLPRNAELSGKYVCKASNFAGETQIASNILFQGKGGWRHSNAQFIMRGIHYAAKNAQFI